MLNEGKQEEAIMCLSEMENSSLSLMSLLDALQGAYVESLSLDSSNDSDEDSIEFF